MVGRILEVKLKKPIHLKWVGSRSGPGTPFYEIGMALAEALKAELPPGSSMKVLRSLGGLENPQLVAERKADIGISIQTPVKWALEGKAAYSKRMPNLRGIASLPHPEWFSFLATVQTGLTSLEEVGERRYPLRIVTSHKASYVTYAVAKILDAHGFTFEDIERWGGRATFANGGQAVSMIKGGRADAFAHHCPRCLYWTEITVACDVRFLPLKKEAIGTLCERYGYVQRVIPAGVHRGLDRDILTVGEPGYLLFVREDMPRDLAYAITKVITENVSSLAVAGKWHSLEAQPGPALKDMYSVPMHPGAAEYYRSRGWIR